MILIIVTILTGKNFMKKLLLLIILSPLIVLGQTDCLKSIKLGNVDVCIPLIEGMTEAYSNTIVKKISDSFKYSDDELIFAIYMTDENLEYEKILDNGLAYPLYKLYGNKKFIDLDFSKELFDRFKVSIKKTFGEDLSEIVNKVNGKLRAIENISNINLDKPVLIDSYDTNTKSNTNTLLMKVISEGEKLTVVANITVFLIKKRIIFYANYNNYNGIESVEKTNNQTNYFIKKIFSVN